VTLIVDVSGDGARLPLSRSRVKDIAIGVLKSERVRDALVSITFVSRREIARLNRAHLGHAGATDVISFSLGQPPNPGDRRVIVGDIYIAPDVARANVARLGGGVRDELARLVIHGTLHVLGHEHPEGPDRTASAMWKRQERLLATLGRPSRRGAPR
jgi:probable rRNA maturation factor